MGQAIVGSGPDGKALFTFRLYIAGNAPNSVLAVRNLHELCQCYLSGRHSIEVIDLLEQPESALSHRVFMTPTLVKVLPKPELRVVGSLSDASAVLKRLGLDISAP